MCPKRSSHINTNMWILDTGATRHICSYKSLFLRVKSLQNSSITLPNHSSIPVHFFGDVKINCDLLLRDVLLVLSFKINLISVSALTHDLSVKVSFTDNGFPIQDIAHQMMIGKGDRNGDLYVLTSHIHQQNDVINKVTTQVWHRCLVHFSCKLLDFLNTDLIFCLQ